MNDYCSCLSPKSIRLTIRLGRPVSGEGGRFEVPAPLSLPWRAPRSMTIVTKNLPLLFFFFFFVFCVWREKTTARTRRPCAMRELDDDLALLERVHVRITVSNAWGSRERHNTFAPLFPEKPGRVCVCVGGGGGFVFHHRPPPRRSFVCRFPLPNLHLPQLISLSKRDSDHWVFFYD